MQLELKFNHGDLIVTVRMQAEEYAVGLKATPLPADHDLQGLEHTGTEGDILRRLACMFDAAKTV